MKKFFIASLSFMLLALSCFGLVACNNMMRDKTISASDGATLGENVRFTNQSDFKLSYKGDRLYKATGTASTMTEQQATAYGGSEGDKYVVLEIEADENSTIKYGFVSSENKDKTLGEVNEPTIKEFSLGDDDEVDMILRLNKPESPYWRVEITKQGEAESTAYLVDFSSFYSETQTTT